jgi:hypothetical protein
VSAAVTRAWWLAGTARERRAAWAAGAKGPQAAPLVAVLCTAPRARVATAGVALALAHATGSRCAIAGAVGTETRAALGGTPAARRSAMALRRRGLPASASGRLVWVADRRGQLVPAVGNPLDGPATGATVPVAAPTAEPTDVAARVAALSAELGRSAATLGLPAAVALPFARTEALDRVLAWHDAIVVVREPDAPAAVLERALESLAALGRPVVAMAPPARLFSVCALAGLGAAAEAVSAVDELARGGTGRAGPGDG